MASADNGNGTPGYLVFDTESVPDGRLLSMVKYPDESLSPDDAIRRAQAEAREKSFSGSDFLPVSFQVPVATCVIRVGADFRLQHVASLDAPEFRPRKIVEAFWSGVGSYRAKYPERIKLITFNGRGFDLPLLEVSAFRYGCCAKDHFANSRKRYDCYHLDLMDWLTNFNAFRVVGGLNLLSKLLGKPGKMSIEGSRVHELYQAGKLQEINDYCMFDTLDTYFVFLRTRVMTGELTLEDEHIAVLKAKDWLQSKVTELPALGQYLENWGDWNPWP
jgi:3'-5' exonuclease